jgi:cytochrome c-type biogenesis protein CcmE
MKKTHIVLIILAAVAASIMVATYVGLGTNETFDTAFQNPGTVYKIKGRLDKTKAIIYDPQINTNLCVFHMTDQNGETHKVLYTNIDQPKPQGLEMSEEINLHGKVVDGEFLGHKMDLKCPSKYNEEKHLLNESAANNP